MTRVLRVLIVDDEAQAINFPRLRPLMENGLIEVERVPSLDALVTRMGISFDASRKMFSGKPVDSLDFDIVFLDWDLGSSVIRDQNNLSAFAFIPFFQQRYKWTSRGEQVEIVPYSMVWDKGLCASLEGYLLSLQLKKRSDSPSFLDVENTLLEKAFNIISQLPIDKLQPILDSVVGHRNDLLSLHSGTDMHCFALFPALSYYDAPETKLALKDWTQKIASKLEEVILRSSPLYVFCQRAVFVRITHDALTDPAKAPAVAVPQDAKDRLGKLIDQETVLLESNEFIDDEGSTYALPNNARRFIAEKLQELKSALSAPNAAKGTAHIDQVRQDLKERLRFCYGEERLGYGKLSALSDIAPPGHSDKWCSYVYRQDMEAFLASLVGQLKPSGAGLLSCINIDENKRVALWHFVQEDPIASVAFGAIQNSFKWTVIWDFARAYGDLYCCVTETDEGRNMTTSTWRTSRGNIVEAPSHSSKSAFVLVLPVWELV